MSKSTAKAHASKASLASDRWLAFDRKVHRNLKQANAVVSSFLVGHGSMGRMRRMIRRRDDDAIRLLSDLCLVIAHTAADELRRRGNGRHETSSIWIGSPE